MLRDFFVGFIKIHIVHHAALHELQCRGSLTREDRVVQGKVRKYYRTTPRGKATLAKARAKMVAEMLCMEEPRSLAGEEDHET
jgi:DNA-binding PadR family transcriptional regulator